MKEQKGALGAKVDALMKEKDRALQSKHQILIQSTRDILKVLSASQLSLERERFQAQLEDSEAKWWRGISAHENQYVCASKELQLELKQLQEHLKYMKQELQRAEQQHVRLKVQLKAAKEVPWS